MSLDFVSVRCACGKKLKAPATSAGRKGRCPACGNTLVLAAAGAALTADVTAGSGSTLGIRKAPPAPSPALIPTENDHYLDSLYELAQQAESAPAISDGARCPQCRSGMADGAVLCVNCGYDARIGTTRSTSSVSEPVKRSTPVAIGSKPKKVDRMAPNGSFVAGLAMSAVFALAASVLWFVVAWATGYALGLIAIAIGGAAGVGMQIGQKGYSYGGGIAAAGMTLAAIVIAKLALIQFIILPAVFHHHGNPSISNLNSAAVSYLFFRPTGLIIMFIGMATGFRTASGSVSG